MMRRRSNVAVNVMPICAKQGLLIIGSNALHIEGAEDVLAVQLRIYTSGQFLSASAMIKKSEEIR